MDDLRHETALAKIERMDAHRVEVRFKPAVRVDAKGIAEIMGLRKALCGMDRVAILVVIPSDVELDMGLMNLDHYRANDSADQLTAVAVVAEGSMGEMMVRLYYAYFPPTFQCQMFSLESEAALWLRQQVKTKA
ncbi:MAG: hypothetical protein KA175_03245 [Flavobacteriales bacterium]|nr:hypothetical protein [Flavobacteriales bacterium]